jgi:hypothetical protein
MRWILIGTLNIVEAPCERGGDVEADAIRPGSGFAGPGYLYIDQTGALFNGFLRRDIESLPPSFTSIRDKYIGLGKKFKKLLGLPYFSTQAGWTAFRHARCSARAYVRHRMAATG